MSWRFGRRWPVAKSILVKTLAMTQDDFVRHLPILLPDGYSVDAETWLLNESGRMLTIRMNSNADRVLGKLRLPQLRVEFEFDAYSEQEVDVFMCRLSRLYHRGGG
ncbi:conserved protein of unknown function [Methylotuvimicrobium alcaliphilum 20Z]|uniref:Uncharacterized protein n=1 Tax=Methylotuvimicrobium alcaliphilum (strain DSM 19304 / NCIMB 14124 / VKM B-2133 / 20Z) TaxID=1091494 RepID=G4T243_META2|nr:conserved protein of unknown function [Methylotuvimicrobium alcaliphilum 20Z]